MKFIAAALIVFAAAGAARAADSFSAFQTYCVATKADQKAALAAADAAGGWIALDPSQVPMPANPTFKLDSYQVRARTEGGGYTLLVVGTGHASLGQYLSNVPSEACMVIAKPVDASAADRMKTFAAVPVTFSQPGGKLALYGYINDDAGAHRTFTSPDEARTMLALGRTSLALSAENNGNTVLGVVNLKP